MQMSKIANVLDSASMGIWRITILSNNKPKLNASPKMLELLGLDDCCPDTEEEVFEAWANRVCPESKDATDKYLSNIINNGHDEVVYKWNHPKLGVRYVRCGGVGYKESDGTQVLEGYHYDVTEYMEQHLQDTLIVNALANTYSCMFYIDLAEDRYVSYTNNLANVAQKVPKEGTLVDGGKFIAENFSQPFEHERLAKFVDMTTINERMKNTNTVSITYRGVLVDWVRLTLVVTDRNADGTISHMLATIKDVTDIKRLEKDRLEELKANIEANRAKTMMLQNMTHEIRTPLNAMFGFSQLLSMSDENISAEQRAEYFNYIYNSFNMLTMLIDDVLDIADAEHGNYRINKHVFSVNAMCRNAMEMAELRCPAGVKMYSTSEVEDTFTIDSDDRRIQQVLVNYLTNSCKHTQKGEIHLHVSTTEHPGRLTFSVTDTGEGIPVDERHDIFKRYKKANNCIKGSGLGLNICSTIADKLGGEVKLDESYNNGARFVFIL